ncbi:MAG: hypothetical protein ACTHKR_12290 [Sphingomonas sp.]
MTIVPEIGHPTSIVALPHGPVAARPPSPPGEITLKPMPQFDNRDNIAASQS